MPNQDSKSKDYENEFIVDVSSLEELSDEDYKALLEHTKAENLADTVELEPNDIDAEGNPIYIPPN